MLTARLLLTAAATGGVLAGCASAPENPTQVAYSSATPVRIAPAQVATDGDPAHGDDAAPQQVVGSTDSVWAYLSGKYDTDGDGAIHPDEYGRDPANFARLDRDSDGAITVADVERDGPMGGITPAMMAPMIMLRYFQTDEDSSSLAREELVDATTEYDTNADGAVDREEFEAGTSRRGSGGMRMPGMDRFDALASVADADHDGRLARDELLSWFDATDSDNNGELSMGGRHGSGGRDSERRGADGRRPPRDPEAPAGEGRMAPDFTLAPLHGGDPLTLASFTGKRPVALIFGSYT